MKKSKSLIPLLQNRILQEILEELVAEIERIKSTPAVSSTDTVELRNAINKITGKI